MSVLRGLFSAVSGIPGDSLLIVLVVTFILLEVPGIPDQIKVAFTDSEDTFGRLRLIVGNAERHVVLNTVVSLVTETLMALWLAILGVDFPLLEGLLAFLLNYFPTFASVVAAVPPS